MTGPRFGPPPRLREVPPAVEASGIGCVNCKTTPCRCFTIGGAEPVQVVGGREPPQGRLSDEEFVAVYLDELRQVRGSGPAAPVGATEAP